MLMVKTPPYPWVLGQHMLTRYSASVTMRGRWNPSGQCVPWGWKWTQSESTMSSKSTPDSSAILSSPRRCTVRSCGRFPPGSGHPLSVRWRRRPPTTRPDGSGSRSRFAPGRSGRNGPAPSRDHTRGGRPSARPHAPSGPGPRTDLERWAGQLVAECKNLLSSVLPLQENEIEFLTRPNDGGEIVPELVTENPEREEAYRPGPIDRHRPHLRPTPATSRGLQILRKKPRLTRDGQAGHGFLMGLGRLRPPTFYEA